MTTDQVADAIREIALSRQDDAELLIDNLFPGKKFLDGYKARFLVLGLPGFNGTVSALFLDSSMIDPNDWDESKTVGQQQWTHWKVDAGFDLLKCSRMSATELVSYVGQRIDAMLTEWVKVVCKKGPVDDPDFIVAQA